MGSTPPAGKKVALITGINKESAQEVARLLGRDHDMIVLVGAPDAPGGHTAAARLAAQDIDARFVRLDVTDPASIAAAARWIDENFGGRLDVLINHAGVILDRSLPGHTEPATFKATFEANVRTPFLVSEAMLPLLQRSDAGRIVNVSSGPGTLAQRSDPHWEFAPYRVLCYNSSKAALHMRTVLFASELARSGSPIKVNAIELGHTADACGDPQDARPIEPDPRAVVRLATLPADAPSGGFFDADHVVPG